MTIEIPTVEPKEFVAGNTVQWKIPENADRTIADSWVLSYALVSKSKNIDIQCTDNGDNHHLATISAEDSKDIPSGHYVWQSYLTKGTERHPVSSGSMAVSVDFASMDGGHDGRTFWRTVLENVQAVIEQRATKDQSSYTVNGRQLSRTSLPDLMMLYDKAKSKVVAEDQASGHGNSAKIMVRF